jgi:hypothetical protein
LRELFPKELYWGNIFNMPKKICNKCEQRKPSDDFYDDSRNICKECKKKYTKNKYWASKDEKSGRHKKDADESNDDDLLYENKKLKKRVRKLEKEMDKMNYIISQQNKEIVHINALIEGFAMGLKVDDEEESDRANITEVLE